VSRTRAAGIGIPDPPRRREILDAVEGSGGEIVEIPEEEIEAAWSRLARQGVLAERASAVVEAAARSLRARGNREPLLGWLTGSGLRE
jgi:threonine synthase